MPRSACIHPDHQPTIEQALKRNGYLTQSDLAIRLEIALSTVSRFFRRIPISIANFENICEALALTPQDIILPPHSLAPVPVAEHSQSPHPQFFAYDSFWVGRDSLIQTLSQQLSDSCRLLLLTGISGIGKTALSECLTYALQNQNDSAQALAKGRFNAVLQENFDNKEQSIDFVSFATRLLEGSGQIVSPEERAHPAQLCRRLVTYLQQYPTLVLIDSLEEILKGDATEGWSEFKDDTFISFFSAIFASTQFQSRLILTSQELPRQLVEAGSRYQTVWNNERLSGLSEAEQTALFEKTGFSVDATLTRIGKAYEGHPLALRTILGEMSDRPFFGNVAAYWKRYGQEIEAVETALAEAAAGQTTGADDKWQLDRFTRALRRNVQTRLEHTLERLRQDARYAYVLLCETSVYRCPVPEDWWLSHLEDWEQSEEQQLLALDALRDRYLVEEKLEDEDILLKQHNLIRSVSLAHLKELTFNL